ncbi:MAG: serpin family protein [Bacteroidales bacterium]|nr:serpin family protein [Bacteroidales bacterium]
MNKIKYFLPLMLVAAYSCSDDVPQTGNPNVPELGTFDLSRSEREVAANVDRFGVDMFNTVNSHWAEISKDGLSENFTVSPLSATVCLAMMANSCDERVAREISEVVGVEDLGALNTLCNKYVRMAAHPGGTDVCLLANSIWYSDRLTVSPDYVKSIRDMFYADVNGADLSSSSTIDLINSWAHANTHGYIDRVADSDDRDKIILWLNAMYFQGEWREKFDKSRTQKEIFHGTGRDGIAAMMHRDGKMEYACEDGFEAVTMPFKGATTITFVLPPEDLAIESLSEKFTYDVWTRLRMEYSNILVHLGLPKYKIASECDMMDALELMGFDNGKTTLSKMGCNTFVPGLECRQYNYMEVDEDGAKVASVTKGSNGDTAVRVDEVTVTFNRPFIFFITNRPTGAVLLAGRVSNI